MCAVALGEVEAEVVVEPYNGRVQVAAVNSANSCTLSGDRHAIREIIERLGREKGFCRELRVNQVWWVGIVVV